MKYFSLSFSLKKEDFSAYYKEFSKGLILNQLKRSLITLAFIAVLIVLNLNSLNAGLITTVAFIAVITVFMPIFYSKKLSVSLLDSKKNRKVNTYDFYADHIEVNVMPDESSSYSFENHFKMKGFVSVCESKTSFYFSYMNDRVLIIPKRVLDSEKYAMIKNLIDNYFSNVYMTI